MDVSHDRNAKPKKRRKPKTPSAITEKAINKYMPYLKEEDRASGTIEKYAYDIRSFAAYLDG